MKSGSREAGDARGELDDLADALGAELVRDVVRVAGEQVGVDEGQRSGGVARRSSAKPLPP